jgi:hypothetical protein
MTGPFYVGDDYFEPEWEPSLLGSTYDMNGPEELTKTEKKRLKAKEKRPFGFSRALEDVTS